MLPRWLTRRGRRPAAALIEHPCQPLTTVEIGGRTHDLSVGAQWHEDLGHPDWVAVDDWIGALPATLHAEARLACARTWLTWLGNQFDGCRLFESDTALLLTSQGPEQAAKANAYIAATEKRIRSMLEELAQPSGIGRHIVLALRDLDAYYRYLSRYESPDRAHAVSSGVFIGEGCAHFVTQADHMTQMEPIIAHEMTHAFLAHLPLPLWLNEGIAVNCEHQATGQGQDGFAARELAECHRRYWTPRRIQRFWSGEAYHRPDEGNELAYDLGRLLVRAIAADWPTFKRFIAAAEYADAGATAAEQHLGLDLGESVRSLLRAADGDWAPAPASW